MSCSRVQQRLRAPVRERRAVGERAARAPSTPVRTPRRDDARGEADLHGPVGVDPVAQQQQLGRAPQADHAGEQVGAAHVRAGQPDPREQERERRALRQHAQVGGQRDAPRRRPRRRRSRRRPRASGSSRIRWTTAPVIRVKSSVPAGSIVQQLADDLVDVPARAEPAAGPREDQRRGHRRGGAARRTGPGGPRTRRTSARSASRAASKVTVATPSSTSNPKCFHSLGERAPTRGTGITVSLSERVEAGDGLAQHQRWTSVVPS